MKTSTYSLTDTGAFIAIDYNLFLFSLLALGDQLHLGQLAAFCGVSVKTTHTDVRLILSSDSCYVKQEVGLHLELGHYE